MRFPAGAVRVVLVVTLQLVGQARTTTMSCRAKDNKGCTNTRGVRRNTFRVFSLHVRRPELDFETALMAIITVGGTLNVEQVPPDARHGTLGGRDLRLTAITRDALRGGPLARNVQRDSVYGFPLHVLGIVPDFEPASVAVPAVGWTLDVEIVPCGSLYF